jgi:hypothetical protein
VRDELVEFRGVPATHGQQQVRRGGRGGGHGDVRMSGGRGRHVVQQAGRDGDPQEGLHLGAEVLRRDLDVEVHQPGLDPAIEAPGSVGGVAAEILRLVLPPLPGVETISVRIHPQPVGGLRRTRNGTE